MAHQRMKVHFVPQKFQLKATTGMCME